MKTERGECVQHEEREDARRREVRQTCAGSDPAQQRVTEDEAESLPNLGDESGPALGRSWGFAVSDESNEDAGESHADAGQSDGQWGTDRGDQARGQSGASNSGGLLAGLELAVAVGDRFPVDEFGQVGLIGDVEEDADDSDPGRDEIELDHAQGIERPGQRDGQEDGGTDDVAGDDDESLRQTVDPGPGGQADEQESRGFQRCEHSHFESVGVEELHGDEGEGEEDELGSEHRDRVACPQLHEVAVSPQRDVLRPLR